VRLIERLDTVVPQVVGTLRPGDVVITLGAGSVGTLPARLKDALNETEATR
jgi:UDP-N-acetylmuramate-alanine ligase